MCDDAPFNKLTPAEAERLDILQEECAEVIQAVAKIKRHGYASNNPDIENHRGNRDDLTKELGHVMWIVHLMIDVNDVDSYHMHQYRSLKSVTVKKYLHHQ